MKVLFVIHDLEKIGGVTTALKNLLFEIRKQNNLDIHLMIFNKNANCSLIPKEIKIESSPYLLALWFSDKSTLKGVNKIMWYLLHGIGKYISEKCIWWIVDLVKKNKEMYDVAIAYENDLPGVVSKLFTNDYVLKKVRAEKYVSFIHNDPYKLGFTKEYILKRYKKFDCIVCVSNATAKKIIEICPDYKKKVSVVYNFFEMVNMPKKEQRIISPLRLVSVARLDNKQKRIDRIIDCCDELKRFGITKIQWDIYGSGTDENMLRAYAKEKQVLDILSFRGITYNPIETIASYDIFVMSSDYEAFGLVLVEALLSKTPVICTDFEEAYENIDNGKTGFIVEKSSIAIAEKIRDIILEPQIIFELENYINNKQFNNDKQMQQFLTMLESKA